MVRIYYRGAAAAIMCCDLTDPASFDGLQTWEKELRGVLGDDVVVCIAVTKGDKEDRQVTLEQLESYASSIGASVTVTSAMTKDGVEELFHDLARRLIAAAPKVPDVPQFSLEGDFTQRPACGC
jgi:GTPase SAR1 family protein